MNNADQKKDFELLYQNYIAARVGLKITKQQIKNIPDDHPKKAEVIKRLQEMKKKVKLIDKLFFKDIDKYANMFDSELFFSLHEDDIILLRKELAEVRKSIMEMQM